MTPSHLSAIVNQLKTIEDDFTYEMIKTYFNIHKKLSTENVNGYRFSVSNLSITEHHFDLEISFLSNTRYRGKYVILNQAHPLKKDLVDIVGQTIFNEIKEFYEQVLINKDPYFKSIVKNYFKKINLLKIVCNQKEMENPTEFLEKMSTKEIFIRYEKEQLENNITQTVQPNAKVKL